MKIALGSLLSISFILGNGHSAFAEVLPRPYVIGALGDSITAGFNNYRFGDNRDLSWSAGLDQKGLVDSHAKRLQQILGPNIEVHNEAFVGATSKEMERETTRLLRYKPDYVTLLVGANDICNWTGNYAEELANYQKQVSTTVNRLVDANPNIRIVMPSIPDLLRVYEVGKAHECQERWDAMGLCPGLFARDRTGLERQQFGERLQQMNSILATIASSYPANIHFKPELANYQFPWEFLSPIDCFHPSILGHNKIAELTFDPTWH